jgi:hypothetical protein
MITPGVNSAGRRMWHLPNGIIVVAGDRILLHPGQYTPGLGRLVVAITNLGDPRGRFDPCETWVDVSGRQCSLLGTALEVSRELSVLLSAVLPWEGPVPSVSLVADVAGVRRAFRSR